MEGVGEVTDPFLLETNVPNVRVKFEGAQSDGSEPYEKFIWFGVDGVQTSTEFRFFKEVGDFSDGRVCKTRKYVWVGEAERVIKSAERLARLEGRSSWFWYGWLAGWGPMFGIYVLSRWLA